MKTLSLSLPLAAILGLAASGLAEESHPQKPNIVLILLDDVGWGDCGFQGGKEIPTPHMDRIARGGVRFTQGYVCSPLCSPSRAGLMTGRYPTRFGFEFNESTTHTTTVFGLPRSEKTLAERLKELGYSTAIVGKWHLGHALPELLPTHRGFDEFYGTPRNIDWFNFVFYDTLKSPKPFLIWDQDFNTARAYGQRATDFIARQTAQRPFFLYLPFNVGYRRREYHPFTHRPKALPTVEAQPDDLHKFEHIADVHRREFAAMLHAQDEAVGKVLTQLKEKGFEQNTLVILLSDHGGSAEHRTNGPLSGGKGTTSEGGIRVPFCMKWPGRLPAGKVYHAPVINLDILPTCLAAAGGSPIGDQECDGVNLLPYLAGEKTDRPHPTLYWRFGLQRAIRKGDFKLVVSETNRHVPRLVSLVDDLAEQHDLKEKYPELAATLRMDFQAWNNQQAQPLWRP